MSSIRFTITENDPITYYDHINGITPTTPIPYTTDIDEPVGLDSVSLHIRRDRTFHGFFDAVDDSLGALRFYSQSYHILRYAYTTYGTDADVTLAISFVCSDTDQPATLYEGRFSFDRYREVQGIEGCYIEIGIANGQALSVFRSRLDQKVSLDSLHTYDGAHSPLPRYDWLGREITLPSKTVRMIDYATYSTSSDGQGNDINYWRQDNTRDHWFVVYPQGQVQNAELTDFSGGANDLENNVDYNHASNNDDYIFQFKPENDYLNNTIKYHVHLNFFYELQNPRMDWVHNPYIEFWLIKGADIAAARHNTPLAHQKFPITDNYLDFALFETAGSTTFSPGESLYLLIYIQADVNNTNDWRSSYDFRDSDYGAGIHPDGYRSTVYFGLFSRGDRNLPLISQAMSRAGYYVSTDPLGYTGALSGPGDHLTTDGYIYYGDQSYIKLSIDTQVAASPARVFMVNEALSRITEIITDDQMRVYSDYFGRTDSLPYDTSSSTHTDGPGSLEALSNGLLIRNYSPVTALQWDPTSIQTVTPSTTAYTLSTNHSGATDVGKVIIMGFGTPSTVTIPLAVNTTPAFQIGDKIMIQQGGTGTVAIAGQLSATATVVITSPNAIYTTAGQGSILLLTKIAENEWLLSSQAPMFMSFKELMESLHAIHAVGLGTEADPHHAGCDRVRVEPISFFYDKSNTTMTCPNVDMLERECNPAEMTSTFHIGYAKWEAEQSNGLDEFLTQRTFRTTLRNIRTGMDKLAKIVASGYAIEVTRRKFFLANTTDWRYDSDNFIICLKRGANDDLVADQGGIDTPANILDPATVYNYRISPIRNALRWLRYIFQSYPQPQASQPDTRQLIFTSGNGNFYASGKEQLNAAAHKLPIESKSLSENTSLTLADYHDPTIQPIYRPELVKFKYPVSFADWQNIFANKYGLIKYNVNDGDWQYGYIEELKYSIFDGLAEFTLKPKAE